jgi:hypothetical protein
MAIHLLRGQRPKLDNGIATSGEGHALPIINIIWIGVKPAGKLYIPAAYLLQAHLQ